MSRKRPLDQQYLQLIGGPAMSESEETLPRPPVRRIQPPKMQLAQQSQEPETVVLSDSDDEDDLSWFLRSPPPRLPTRRDSAATEVDTPTRLAREQFAQQDTELATQPDVVTEVDNPTPQDTPQPVIGKKPLPAVFASPQTPMADITADQRQALARFEAITAQVKEVVYLPSTLTTLQAIHVVTTMWLAQQLLDRNAQFYLVVGGDIDYPQNQQGVIERKVFARIIVTPDTATIVPMRFINTESEKFGLKCRFVVGNKTQEGVEASLARVPYAFNRPNATPIPWQAYNPAVHSETRTAEDRRLVVFTDAPNKAIHGDSFYM